MKWNGIPIFSRNRNETKIKWSEMNDGNGVCTLKMHTHLTHTFHVVFNGIPNWNLIALQLQTIFCFILHCGASIRECTKSKQSILKIRCKFPNNILLCYWMRVLYLLVFRVNWYTCRYFFSGIALNRDVHL